MAFHPQQAHASTPQKSLLPQNPTRYHPPIWQTLFHPLPTAAPYNSSMTHTFGAELINNVIASLTLKYRWMDGFKPKNYGCLPRHRRFRRRGQDKKVELRHTHDRFNSHSGTRVEQQWSKHQCPCFLIPQNVRETGKLIYNLNATSN
jgi:hypothetical protein